MESSYEVEPIHSPYATNVLYDLSITLDALSADAERIIFILCFTLRLNGAIPIPLYQKPINVSISILNV